MSRLRTDIQEFLLEHGLQQDVTIFEGGKMYSCGSYGSEWECIGDGEPDEYFEYYGDRLSMSFEGPLYKVLNVYWERESWTELYERFDDLFRKYGVYFEQGDAWNLSVYR